MDYKKRVSAFSILDSVIVLTAIYISYWLLHPSMLLFSNKVILISALTLLVSHHITAFIFHLYDRIWSVASVRELLIIAYAVTIAVAIAGVVQFIVNADIYYRVLGITWMLHIIMIGGSRFLIRVLNDRTVVKKSGDLKRVLIVGAGQAGTMLARSLRQNPSPEYYPVAFIDDDVNKQNLTLFNTRVMGTTKEIATRVNQLNIAEIIVAMPSLTKPQFAKIYNRCTVADIPVKAMPRIEDVMTGNVSVNDMREVNIEDLLGRDEVQLDLKSISANLTNKTILVTGAGGSIGSEICRQVLKFHPSRLILLGHGENSIYTIHMELVESGQTATEFIPVIADVQDRQRIFEIVELYKPDVIYHAAAHKHVPLMEHNPQEAVKNNVFGTKNMADAAHLVGVSNFVLISTDKAVNPPNVMGATKRIAEMVIQNIATYSETTFAAVRFGNVLGSRGSVVPRFKAQIAAGGPVTVTHPDMTRYFMTIPEASRLVLQAGALARGGEVFVLDMGEPVKIVDLAKNLIRLSGFSEEDIQIEYSGIRPGEKMYEELLNPEEIQEEHVYPKIHVGKANCMDSSQLLAFLSELETHDLAIAKKQVIKVANGQWESYSEMPV